MDNHIDEPSSFITKLTNIKSFGINKIGLSPGTPKSGTPFPRSFPSTSGSGMAWDISIGIEGPTIASPWISFDKIHTPGSTLYGTSMHKWPKDRLVKGQNYQPHMSCAMYLSFTLYIHILGIWILHGPFFFRTLETPVHFLLKNNDVPSVFEDMTQLQR